MHKLKILDLITLIVMIVCLTIVIVSSIIVLICTFQSCNLIYVLSGLISTFFAIINSIVFIKKLLKNK